MVNLQENLLKKLESKTSREVNKRRPAMLLLVGMPDFAVAGIRPRVDPSKSSQPPLIPRCLYSPHAELFSLGSAVVGCKCRPLMPDMKQVQGIR